MNGFLGIDWGTHSSKWAYQTGSGSPVIGEIWDSAVTSLDDRLLWFPLEERFQDSGREVALKRKLIQDPDQSFWEGSRPKIKVTLGEAVVFSLLALLLDADGVLSARRKTLKSDSLTVRFSHPNWISEENVRALGCFRDAAVVALSIFLEGIEFKRTRGIEVERKKLRDAIERHRPIRDRIPSFPEYYDHSRFESCARGVLQKVSWELVFESCAAGFPYVIQGERELLEAPITQLPAHRRVRKLLVVDVGAGSTDAGYLLRTIRPRDSQRVMRPLLIWLPAANALEVAGQWLTKRILADLRQQGRRVTDAEAEEFKLGSPQLWSAKPYLGEWNKLIADHVGDYVGTICDGVCLPNSPPLEIVVTGGSSAVTSMRKEVLRHVQQALRDRGLSEDLSNATALTEASSLGGLGRAYQDIEIAQLAVCLGASDPHLAELKAYPTGL